MFYFQKHIISWKMREKREMSSPQDRYIEKSPNLKGKPFDYFPEDEPFSILTGRNELRLLSKTSAVGKRLQCRVEEQSTLKGRAGWG